MFAAEGPRGVDTGPKALQPVIGRFWEAAELRGMTEMGA